MSGDFSFAALEFGSQQYWQSVELRRRLLRLPLGLDFSQDELAEEAAHAHLAAIDTEGNVVAIAVLVPLEHDVAKMRQVAVDDRLQGQGVGAALVAFVEEMARRGGFSRIVLNAREPAVAFYLKLGYALEGEPFLEVGIQHRRMSKDVAKP